MRREDFHYDLPPELVAQRPADARDGSRLLRVHPEGPPTIGPFAGILDAFRGGEVLVVNDTRVVPARVRGHKESGGAVEVFIVEPLPEGRVLALVRGKRLRGGAALTLPGGARAVLVERRADGTVELALEVVDALWPWLDAVGEVPLPPYIERAPEASDRGRYQTVFARAPGAVAAPTAGLHFTPVLLDALRARGVDVHTVTLHVGLGTFLPVRADDLDTHVMHSERFSVPPATRAALESGRPVVAVGTTVVRALESHARDPAADRTALFIRPGFDFRVIDGLITNFHLPESTLLMLVSALGGHDRVMGAYRAAVSARLRFFSYGDAMLLRREGARWT